MIYLVEDDESIRELVVYTLKSQGMDAKGFERPSLFWKELEKEVPALILLDIMLPEEDGISILRKLRTRPDTRKIPVIMLTAKGTEYDKVVGLDSGADDFEADGDCFTIYTDPDDFNAVADALAKKGYTFVSAQIEMVPGEYKKLDNPDDITNMEKMLDIFEDDDDVQNVWHNWDRD